MLACSLDQLILASRSLAVRCQDGRMNPWEVFILFFTPLTMALSAAWRCTERWCSRCRDDRSGLASSTLPFWNLCLFCCSSSSAFVHRITRNTPRVSWNLRRKCLTCTLPVGLFGSLCSCSPFLTPLSVSLYLLHLLHPILSQSLSINKSFLAGCSRLNQPLCKHGC